MPRTRVFWENGARKAFEALAMTAAELERFHAWLEKMKQLPSWHGHRAPTPPMIAAEYEGVLKRERSFGVSESPPGFESPKPETRKRRESHAPERAGDVLAAMDPGGAAPSTPPSKPPRKPAVKLVSNPETRNSKPLKPETRNSYIEGVLADKDVPEAEKERIRKTMNGARA
jgi:hypothetical protein